ncbi:MAG: hypothetical protein RR348_00960 [Clostridia bacterium]
MVWWIIVGVITFLTSVILLVVAIGIQASFYFDYTTMSGCADIYIFNKMLILKLRFFECNQKLYAQVNRKALKELKKSHKKKRTVEINFEKMPTITLQKFCFACVFGNDDLAILGQIFGIASASLPCIDVLFENKIKVKYKKIRMYPLFTTSNLQCNGQIVIKFSIFKILFFAIATLLKSKKPNASVVEVNTLVE